MNDESVKSFSFGVPLGVNIYIYKINVIHITDERNVGNLQI